VPAANALAHPLLLDMVSDRRLTFSRDKWNREATHTLDKEVDAEEMNLPQG
jgi:hypothetical protein